MGDTLRLMTLGGLQIRRGEEPVTGFESLKARALLVYLAVERREHSRLLLAGLFWGDRPDSRALGNLRRVLTNLRGLVGEYLLITPQAVSFNPNSDYWLDVQELVDWEIPQGGTKAGKLVNWEIGKLVNWEIPRGGTKAGRLVDWEIPQGGTIAGKLEEREAGFPVNRESTDLPIYQSTNLPMYQPTNLPSYPGDFMEGFFLDECPAFEEWVRGWRERLRTIALSVFHNLSVHHLKRGEYDQAIVLAGRLLALDPWREETHRQLMLLYALTGQRRAALAQYDECRRMLETELGVEPLEETTALYKRLEDWEIGKLVDWEAGRLVDWETPQGGTKAGKLGNWKAGKLIDKEIGKSVNQESTNLPISQCTNLPTYQSPNLPIYQSTNLPFSGRGEEHARLVEWWRAAQHGRGRLTLVAGEAGIGKTRLVEEVLRFAGAQGAAVMYGRCYEFGTGVPYQPIASALRSALAEDSGRSRLEELEPVWLAELAHLLPELQDLCPGVEVNSTLPAETARQRFFDAVARFLQAGGQRTPTCMFLDDLHWADASTLDLLHYLVRTLENNPIWLVGAYRPEEITLGHPLNRLRQGLSRDNRVDLLTLSPLPVEAINWIACSLVGDGAGSDLGEFLHRECEGNPFIMTEILNDLQEQGVFQWGEKGMWHWPGLSPATILPSGVQDIILQRVGRLSEESQQLLALAAVIGRQFDDSLLRAAAGRDVDEVDHSLSEWLARRLVRPHPARRLDFTHDKIRAVVYQACGAGERRLLHSRVGQALEELAARYGEEDAGLLAYHWEQADEVEKAIPYLLKAGDQARTVYAHREALDYYRRAMVVLREQGDSGSEQAARTSIKMGLTFHNAFDFKQARQAFDEGFSFWQQAGINRSRILPPASRPLRVRWSEPGTLDPTMSPDSHTSVLAAHLFSGLVETGPAMDVAPDLALSWEISGGGREYLFHLRREARWSDGQPVTAGDFVYAWKRVLTMSAPTACFMHDIKGAVAFQQGKGCLGDVGLSAPDDHRLCIELAEPAGFFLQLLAHTPFYPIPRHLVEIHGESWSRPENLVTNGPFRLHSWERGNRLVLARDPNYHGRFHGNLQLVELNYIDDWPSRLRMYESNDLDVLGITHLNPAERESLQQRHAGEYLPGLKLGTYYLVFDVNRPPFNDPRVRQAFALAVDKEGLADVALQGSVYPAAGGFLPRGMPGHTPGIGLSYDPERARGLLSEAGYPNGRNFPTVSALSFLAVDARSSCLRDQWRENLGIDVHWETVEWGEFVVRLKKEPPQLFNAIWTADYPDPDNLMRVSRAETWSGWQSEAYDRLVEQARRTLDQAERLALYAEADRLIINQAPILPLTYERDHLLIKPWVKKYPAAATQAAFWKDVVVVDW